MELLLVPIGLLPGTGLLILSTSSRYLAVVAEIRSMNRESCSGPLAALEMHRARLFRNGLVSLYIAIALASTSALVGGVWSLWDGGGREVAVGGTALAIACIVYAGVVLIHESLLSLRIVELHTESSTDTR